MYIGTPTLPLTRQLTLSLIYKPQLSHLQNRFTGIDLRGIFRGTNVVTYEARNTFFSTLGRKQVLACSSTRILAYIWKLKWRHSETDRFAWGIWLNRFWQCWVNDSTRGQKFCRTDNQEAKWSSHPFLPCFNTVCLPSIWIANLLNVEKWIR